MDSKAISADNGADAPLLSVIIPALRIDLELRRCIDSVRLALPHPHQCEIVLVVPHAQLQAAGDLHYHVRVIAETRPSVYGAMNDGAAASRGRYLYFLGKDDILLPAAREVAGVLASTQPGILFSDVYWGDEGVRSGATSKWKILFRNVCQQGIIYSRANVARNGPFLRRLRVQADHLLNIKILWDERSGPVAYVRKPLAWYAATGLSFTARDTTFYRVHPAIIRRHLGPLAAFAWRLYKKVRPDLPGS